jgi:release factor glutamine methyltransferase
MKSVLFVIDFLTTKLRTNYTQENARHNAWWLLEAVTGLSRTQLLIDDTQCISNQNWVTLNRWLHEHSTEHKPLQYLIGWVPFCNVRIAVRPPILIPRSETEEWCMRLIAMIQKAELETLDILDLCTGSGCIALALAHAFPQSTVIAVDNSPEALAVMNENAQLNHITNCIAIHSDLFTALDQKSFDLIVANPPYIASAEWNSLDTSVQQWEDPHALIGGCNGEEIIARIITDAPRYLKKENSLSTYNIPQLVVEIGYQQANTIKALMQANNYHAIDVWQDLAGNDRIVCGTPQRDF